MAKPPSWNEIRANAQAFVTRWEGTTDENAEAQTFWNEFLGVFGVDRRRVASFEARAKRASTGGRGRIDLFWPGTLVAEHKSAGKDLIDAEQQALDYLDSIDQESFPGVIITSDFDRLRIRDLGGDNVPYTVSLKDLPREIDRFAFIAGYRQRTFGDEGEESANIAAAKLMAGLYEELSRGGYEGHDASVLMTRLLFLMFGDDTGMWEKALFSEFIETRTQDDGSDVGPQLAFLFQILDKAEDKRPAHTDELLMRFPYVNGRLFSDRIDIPVFDKQMRNELIKCANFNWALISPAVFGSLFQAVKSKEARRSLGEHYTTEQNILRALGPLFLDELRASYMSAEHSVQRLERLHDRLAEIRVMDPACGCGNFLVIAYRELRRLELAIVKRIAELEGNGQMVMDVSTLVRVRLSNFVGIEYEEWPARIAEVAMFLVDQQANHELARTFGQAPDRLPIMNAALIHVGNALRTEWNDVLPNTLCSFIVGNPPFIGKKARTDEQQADMDLVFAGWKSYGNLDYVTGWYAKAAKYIRGTPIRAALVSTSSICQGEQVELLWGPLLEQGIAITFAHRQFHWSSETAGAAGVTVIIVGFCNGADSPRDRVLYDYPKDKEAPIALSTRAIGPYLTANDPIIVTKRKSPLCDVALMSFGSMPNDNGLLFVDDPHELAVTDPIAASFVRRFYGAHELIHDEKRWCLWVNNADPTGVAKSRVLRAVAEQMRAYRSASTRAATAVLADFPLRFGEVRQPTARYLALPRHFSQNRRFVPCMFLERDDIAGDALMTIAGADDYLFGIISSSMFMTWQATVGGRIRKDYRLSAEIVYNNFPFPASTPAGVQQVAAAAQGVLHARSKYPGASLAVLYDPAAMPTEVVYAHNELDRAVDKLFGGPRFATEASRAAALLDLYASYTANLLESAKGKRRT